MILFKELIEAVQSATKQASQAIADQNYEILKSYFYATPAKPANTSTPEPENHLSELSPKMVAMRYPKETAQGPAEHTVYVPLISLIPNSNFQLSKLEVEIDLEIIEQENQVFTSFSQSKKGLFGTKADNNSNANARVKITIDPTGSTEGVSTIIEGYNKALRAQIPNL